MSCLRAPSEPLEASSARLERKPDDVKAVIHEVNVVIQFYEA